MIVTVLGFVLFLGGAGAGGVFAGRLATDAGLLDVEPTSPTPLLILE